jgi:nicotinate phosphoribosyltransferase
VLSRAQGEPVIEPGMRRAHGIDGSLAATRASFVGGCHATSNTLAGKLYGIPVRGTHAHSWVMLHDSEREAFMEYARALPANCIFLVDTYATRDGIENAIEAGRWLRSQGKEMVGIRLDSGDLAWLSIEARRRLDEAGFPKAAILASNELDENVIQSLKEQGARIVLWGVGTRLVTAHGDGALGGVYKLTAVRAGPGAPWQPRLKVSEQIEKTSVPGVPRYAASRAGRVRRGRAWDERLGLPEPCVLVDPLTLHRREIPLNPRPGSWCRSSGRAPRHDPPLADVRARMDPSSRSSRRNQAIHEPAPVPGRAGRGLHEGAPWCSGARRPLATWGAATQGNMLLARCRRQVFAHPCQTKTYLLVRSCQYIGSRSDGGPRTTA